MVENVGVVEVSMPVKEPCDAMVTGKVVGTITPVLNVTEIMLEAKVLKVGETTV